MKVEIKVPPAGESVSEAMVAAILKPNGSTVQKDDEIVEIETEKVNQVIHAPESGTLHLTVQKDESVKIGQIIGTIDTSGAKTAPEAPTKAPVAEKPVERAAPQKTEAPTPKAPGPSQRHMGSDFIASLDSKPAAPSSPKVVSAPQEGQNRKKMSSLRRTIAKRLVEVKNQTAMLTTFNEVDLQRVIEIRAKEKDAFEKKHGARLGFMSFFTKAAVQALKAFPDVNAFLDGDEIVYNEHCHIGIAVSTEKGLMVPVMRHAETLSFAQIEKSIVDSAKKVREGKISIDELQGGTFTITNAGKFGSMLSTPILNPPQSAILGMHNIVKRAVVVDDQIVIRPIMYLALSYDHRIIDGETAVSFLMHIRQNLEEPARLMLDF